MLNIFMFNLIFSLSPFLSPSHLTPTSLSPYSPLHLFSSIIASDEEEPTSAGKVSML